MYRLFWQFYTEDTQNSSILRTRFSLQYITVAIIMTKCIISSHLGAMVYLTFLNIWKREWSLLKFPHFKYIPLGVKRRLQKALQLHILPAPWQEDATLEKPWERLDFKSRSMTPFVGATRSMHHGVRVLLSQFPYELLVKLINTCSKIEIFLKKSKHFIQCKTKML